MLARLLAPVVRAVNAAAEMPGGLRAMDVLYAGIREGNSDTYKGANVVEVEAESLFKVNARVVPRDSGGLATRAYLTNKGLERARAMPQAINNGVNAAPGLISAMYAPIHQLAATATDTFRRGQLPPVTGLEGTQTLGQMIADALKGAQVGVGSLMPTPLEPPPPYKAALSVLTGGLLAKLGEQLWGYLNDRQGAEQPGNWQGPTDDNVLANSVVEGQGNGSGSLVPVVVDPTPWLDPAPYGMPPDNASVSTWYKWVEPQSGNPWGWQYWYSWSANGQVFTGYMQAGILGNPATDFRTYEQGPLMEVYWTRTGSSDRLPEAEPLYPSPAPNPQVVPEPLPEPQKLPTQPAPLPLTVPALPGADPVAPPANPPATPGTTPSSPPAVRPQAPPVPSPLPVEPPAPDARPTDNGALVPLAPPAPAQTPTDAHIVNGQPIRSPGPQPTPEGIAQELGRVEKKLAQLLDPKWDEPDKPRDRLGWLRDNIGNIVDALLSIPGSGEYRLSSPCELDGNGNRIERVVQYDGNLQSLGVVSNKIDALAELLQVHKDLKQPICRQLPPVGQPVTVNFVQTD